MSQQQPNGTRCLVTLERIFLRDIKRDVQSAYLGCPARDALIRSVGRMTLTRDPRAPTVLTDAQKWDLEQDPQLVALVQQKQILEANLKFQAGSVPKIH